MSPFARRSVVAVAATSTVVAAGAGVAVYLPAVTALGMVALAVTGVIALAVLGIVAAVLLHRSGLPAYRLAVLVGVVRASCFRVPGRLVSSTDQLPASTHALGETHSEPAPPSPR